MGSKQSQVIKRVLVPAVKLWLRSQVKAVEGLEVKIEASDRQLLAGSVDRVLVKASQIIYRGLHLHKIKLEASDIRTNLPQVIRGKPLQLLEPISAISEVNIKEADLNASLGKKSLLAKSLTDLLCQLLKAGGAIAPEQVLKENHPRWEHISMEGDRLTITGSLPNTEGNQTLIIISSHLQLASSNQLLLSSLDLQSSADLNLSTIDSYSIDLGSDVEIQELTITHRKLVCYGRINVIP